MHIFFVLPLLHLLLIIEQYHTLQNKDSSLTNLWDWNKTNIKKNIYSENI